MKIKIIVLLTLTSILTNTLVKSIKKNLLLVEGDKNGRQDKSNNYK